MQCFELEILSFTHPWGGGGGGGRFGFYVLNLQSIYITELKLRFTCDENLRKHRIFSEFLKITYENME